MSAGTLVGKIAVSVQVNTFHSALTAFEIRFDIELTSRWQELEYEAAVAPVDAQSEKKRSVLNRFFEDAQTEIGNVVHKYFPRLLQVAMTQRQHLENESPLAWTQAQVLRQVCNFLGVDEKFDHTSPPRDDSRLVVATARIALGVGWPDEVIPPDFVLPGWIHSRWAVTQLLGCAFGPRSGDDDESLVPLSRAETLEWIKQREFWISKKLERQIDIDSWDGIIDAGKSDVSVLDAWGAVDGQPSGNKPTEDVTEPSENIFVREVTTWVISLGGETCRLKPMIGLDYIAILLSNPGKLMRALELQTLAGGLSAGATSPGAWNFAEKTDDQYDRPLDQNDFARCEMVDEKARQELKKRCVEIEQDIAYRTEIGDMQKVDELQAERLRPC